MGVLSIFIAILAHSYWLSLFFCACCVISSREQTGSEALLGKLLEGTVQKTSACWAWEIATSFWVDQLVSCMISCTPKNLTWLHVCTKISFAAFAHKNLTWLYVQSAHKNLTWLYVHSAHKKSHMVACVYIQKSHLAACAHRKCTSLVVVVHTIVLSGCICTQKSHLFAYAYGSHLIACTHRNLTRIVLLCLREHVCFVCFFSMNIAFITTTQKKGIWCMSAQYSGTTLKELTLSTHILS